LLDDLEEGLTELYNTKFADESGALDEVDFVREGLEEFVDLEGLFLEVKADGLVVEFSVADLGDELEVGLMVEGNGGVFDHDGDCLVEFIVVRV
jgi:hypothetical protein